MMMYGAIAGDYVGSVIHYGNPYGELDYTNAKMTGNSVLTTAVADAVRYYYDFDDSSINLLLESDEKSLRYRTEVALRKWHFKYPDADYDDWFIKWIDDKGESCHNTGAGAAVRVSPIAWLFRDIKTIRRAAAISASVTHDSPEGIRGAEAVASAVFLARKGQLKNEIKEYISREFGYNLDRRLCAALSMEMERSCRSP